MMLQTSIAIVGRSNVGKSTLFNRLTKTRDAIVGDRGGLTRDRRYGRVEHEHLSFILIDTGGWEDFDENTVEEDMAAQTQQAVEESDYVFFLVDGRSGLSMKDIEINERLRRLGKRVKLVINKAEGHDANNLIAEFSDIAYPPTLISAMHGDGLEELLESLPKEKPGRNSTEEEVKKEGKVKIAIVGRPNVGKSTLVNRLIGHTRVIARDEPGTTRDSILVDFNYHNKDYILIDTAGIRKRARVIDVIEKYSVIKTLQSIEKADVVCLLIDAVTGVSEQDARIGGYILEAGRAVVIATNKWDALSSYQRNQVSGEVATRLRFMEFSTVVNISAKTGRGLANLLNAVQMAYVSATARLSSAKLNRVLKQALDRHSPPLAGRHRPRLKFAHQGGVNPPRIIIHGNGLERLSGSYRRFLANSFIEAFSLKGTPVKLVFRSSSNPFS